MKLDFYLQYSCEIFFLYFLYSIIKKITFCIFILNHKQENLNLSCRLLFSRMLFPELLESTSKLEHDGWDGMGWAMMLEITTTTAFFNPQT